MYLEKKIPLAFIFLFIFHFIPKNVSYIEMKIFMKHGLFAVNGSFLCMQSFLYFSVVSLDIK